jgi:hypothetical protein
MRKEVLLLSFANIGGLREVIHVGYIGILPNRAQAVFFCFFFTNLVINDRLTLQSLLLHLQGPYFMLDCSIRSKQFSLVVQ